jgi:CHAT domain-containing protein
VVRESAEEYVGVPAGFLLAGVSSVISSLWDVPDLSAALLMERFYANLLKRKMRVVSALQEAQAWVRKLNILDVVQYSEKWYRQASLKIRPEFFRLMRHYLYQAKQNSTLCPFAHPYYWAGFVVSGI